MDKQEFRALIQDELRSQKAQIFDADINNPFQVYTEVIDLSTAQSDSNPRLFSFAFKSIALVKGTDTSTEVRAKFNSNDSGVSLVPFKNNSSLSCDRMFSGVSLSWDAQPGKVLTLLLFLNAKYESGSFVNDGTVNVARATATTQAAVTLGAASSTLLLAANVNRERVTFQNNTGASLWIGGVGVTNTGANRGLEILDGDFFSFDNVGAFYGYSILGGTVTIIEET